MTVLNPNLPTVVGAWRMMISHQFTGMDLAEQVARAQIIIEGLPYPPEQVFFSIDHEDFLKKKYGDNTEGIYDWCLEQQSMCDTIIFLIAPGPESSGMQKELALAKKRKQEIIVCVHADMQDENWVHDFCDAATMEYGWRKNGDLIALPFAMQATKPAHA